MGKVYNNMSKNLKPYLITVSSNLYRDRYLEALKSVGDSVELCSVFLEEYPGNLSRFKHIPVKDLDLNRWWIFTDSSDVTFQTLVPNLDYGDGTILVSPEGMMFKDNEFFVQYLQSYPPYPDLLKDRPVYNMGSWAMKGTDVLDLLNFMDRTQGSFNSNEQSDQPMFNLWLIQKNIAIHPNLFTCLYNNLQLGNVIKDGEKYINKLGEPIVIVHDNGMKA